MSKSEKKTKVKIKDRHKLLFREISENIRNGMSMEESMKSVGYSDSYAKTPTRLKDTKSWQQLMEDQLPDELLAKVHKELLQSNEWRARDAGLDKAYKLKRRYKEDIVIENKFGHLSDEELEEELAKTISEAIASGAIDLTSTEEDIKNE